MASPAGWAQNPLCVRCARAGQHLPVRAAGRPCRSVDAPLNDGKGCGTVMRIALLGVSAARIPVTLRSRRDVAALTHGHPSGYLSAAALAEILTALVADATLDDALDPATGRAALRVGVDPPFSPSAVAPHGPQFGGRRRFPVRVAAGVAGRCATSVGGDSTAVGGRERDAVGCGGLRSVRPTNWRIWNPRRGSISWDDLERRRCRRRQSCPDAKRCPVTSLSLRRTNGLTPRSVA